MSEWNKRDLFNENWYYHIYNRWYKKEIIFNNKACYEKFYKYIFKLLKEYKSIQMLSYCLLPNHFHFILKNIWEKSDDISKFMKRLQWSYAVWHRVKYPIEYKQIFFEWRFKSKLIDNEDYLYKCLAYVCYNPVKHKIVKNIKDFPYTSYHQLSNNQKIMKNINLELNELEL